MKRSIALYIIIIIAFSLLTGCDRKIKIENYNKEIKCNLFESKDILFVTSLNTSDKQDFIYLNNKKAYIINYDKLFKSSDQNCEYLTQLSNQIIGVKGNTFFTETELISNALSDLKKLKNKEADDNNWEIIGDSKVAGSEMIFNKFYLKDGVLYSNDNYIIKTSFEKDEKILTVYYQGEYIKTNKHIYKLNKIKMNSEECKKYADVKCKYSYSFNINTYFDKYYKDLLYITVLEDYNFFKKYDWFDAGVLKSGKIIIPDSFKN